MDRKINFFDRLGSLIPGYEGYKEREGRRECDRKLRLKIVSSLDSVEISIMENGMIQLKDLSETETIRKKTENLKDTIKYVSYGESSLFEDSIIREKELDEIYAIDLDLLKTVEGIEVAVKSSNFNEVSRLLKDLETDLIRRKNYLTQN